MVAAVTSGAAGLMRGEQRGAFEHYLSSGGQGKLEKAIPIWAASSGMSAADFRGTLVGGGLGDEGALALQAMGRSLDGGTAVPEVAGASGQHAAAITRASSAG